MSGTYVFLGSTLAPERSREILDAHYLPPVQQGDVLRLLSKRPRVIGIVDGLFRAVPAVWHKEILTALEQGCHVFGAASMGALRAAELSAFGMRGVGEIFQRFRDGTFEDDDEVAVAHASAELGFRELSVPMANIRDMLAKAGEAGVLDAAERQRLVDHAKSRFYPERSVGDLLAQAKRWQWPDEKVRRLSELLADFGPSLKERDAIQMLHEIRTFLEGDPAPFACTTPIERTLFLHNLERDIEHEQTPRRTIDAAASVAETNLPLPALRREALAQILARRVCDAMGWEVTAAEVEMAWEQLRETAHITEAADEAAWLAKTGMTADSARARLRDMVALQKVESELEHQIDRELPDLVAVLSAFARGGK